MDEHIGYWKNIPAWNNNRSFAGHQICRKEPLLACWVYRCSSGLTNKVSESH
ncbi:hypothetical protein J6590_010698, partial [Homalodisca vitripennis]